MAGSGEGKRICLGAIAGPHGVRGLVKVKSFTEVPEDIAAYGVLWDEPGAKSYRLSLRGSAGGLLIASIDGLKDREAAQALRGTRLYVERAALPEPDEEEVYYHADLIGLAAEDEAGAKLGSVKSVNDHGAGDYLEVESPAGPPLLVPFTRAAVPLVDLAAGRLVVAADLLDREGPEPVGAQAPGTGAREAGEIGPKARKRTGQKAREGS